MKTKTPFDEIVAPVQKSLDLIQPNIFKLIATDNPLCEEVTQYFFGNKGKYLRPALCLLSAGIHSGGQDDAQTIDIAAAFEIFHCATLLHDDIIDQADMRRNLPTVNAKWGPEIAVLVGDFLHDRAIQTFFRTKNQALIDLFLKTACDVCDGEILEINNKGRLDLEQDIYFEVIRKKTAVLLAACAKAGGILAGLDDAMQEALYQYGCELGMAFQIVDDCLDFLGASREFGKTLGVDLNEGVVTLPIICLLRRVSPEQKKEVQQFFNQGGEDESMVRLQTLLLETGALEEALSLAEQFSESARKALDVLPDSECRRQLSAVVDFVTSRTH